MYQIVDFFTKKPVHPTGFVFASGDDCWEIQMDMDNIKATLNLDYFKLEPPALSKYLPLMPIRFANQFVSMKEMATPLIKSKVIGPQLGVALYFKVEGKNPTGSFKDRGSSVDITIAKELGAKGIILASTGNMAASVACYAASAHIPCYIVMPEDVSMNKLAQIIAYGAHIVQVKGNYNDAVRLAEAVARKKGLYLAGDYIFRVEGQKTGAFELIDQLLFQVPDVIIIPIGCGTNLTAYAKGLSEYKQLGLIDKIPQLIGVEATGAAAVVNSFNANLKTITPLNKVDTIASAIAIPKPLDGVKALHAIYESNGRAIAVTDANMLASQHLLATEEGLFVETSGAATVSALSQLIEDPHFQGKKIVCILTGDGLKDANLILQEAIKPPVISPDPDEMIKHLF